MNISLQIDGKTVVVKSGMTILEAAKKANIYIPTLCHHDSLNPSGACRLCIVEVEGLRGLPTACTTPAMDGMVVRTKSEKLQSLRKKVLELTLSEHPYTCLICEKKEACTDYMGTIRKAGVVTACQYCPENGLCELQRLVDYLGIKELTFPVHYRSIPVEQDDPFFDRDYNLCILCGRCVRVCNDVRLNGTLTFGFRGDRTEVGTAFGKSHLDVGCEFCGACVDVCPTGALHDKASKWERCPDKSTQSVCPYCSVGCSLAWETDEKLVRTSAWKNGALNNGQICMRGRFGVVDMVRDHERLLIPALRKGSAWAEATWDTALDMTAAQFARYKPREIAVIASPQLPNEDLFLLQKFARTVLGTDQLATSSLTAQWGAAAALAELKKWPVKYPELADIEKANTIVVWGGDLSVTHPILALRIRQQQEKGARIIVVDARTTKLAQGADLHLSLRIGTDLFLMSGLFEALRTRKMIKSSRPGMSVREAAKKTGLPVSLIEAFAAMMAEDPVSIIHGGWLTADGTGECEKALNHLSVLLTGKAVLAGLGESNSRGSLETGCLAGVLPGCIPFSANNKRGKNYSAPLSELKSAGLRGIFKGIEKGRIKALYLAGETGRIESLKHLELLVVQGTHTGGLRETAHILLPAAHHCERDGTLINFEGRIQRMRRVVAPEGMSRPDWWITAQLARRMGKTGWEYKKFVDIYKEFAALHPGLNRIPLGSIGKKGKLLVQAGKSKMDSALYTPGRQSRKTSEAYPFILMLEGYAFRYRQRPLEERMAGLSRVVPIGLIELHPKDARAFRIKTGQIVRVRSRESVLFKGKIRLSDTCPQGALYALYPWTELAPGHLTNRTAVLIEKVKHE